MAGGAITVSGEGGKIAVSGLKELGLTLKKLGDRVEKKGLRKAVGASATIVSKLARSMAPKGRTGKLRRSVFKKTLTAREMRGSKLGIRVGAAAIISVRSLGIKNKTEDPKNAWYWTYVYFGHGNVPANRFLERALLAGAPQALGVLRGTLSKFIDVEVKKLVKPAQRK